MKKAPNGAGTVLKNKKAGTWYYVVSLGSYTDEYGKTHRNRKKVGGFRTRKEAELAKAEYLRIGKEVRDINLYDLYQLWEPYYAQDATRSSVTNYRSTFRQLRSLYGLKVRNIKVMHVQEVINNNPNGHRSKEYIRNLVSLLWNFAVINEYADKNIAQYLTIPRDKQIIQKPREVFSDDEIQALWAHIDTVPFVDRILLMIYTGFRPKALIEMPRADWHDTYLQGGVKTDQGKNRIVPIIPELRPYVKRMTGKAYPFQLRDSDDKLGKHKFYDYYYDALKQCGIARKEPYCCRHTFATLMDRAGCFDDLSKTRLMGHTSIAMTNYYTDKRMEELQSMMSQLVNVGMK